MSMIGKGRVPRAQRREWFGFSSVKKQKNEAQYEKVHGNEKQETARGQNGIIAGPCKRRVSRWKQKKKYNETIQVRASSQGSETLGPFRPSAGSRGSRRRRKCAS